MRSPDYTPDYASAPGRNAEEVARTLRNARAAERERLRNIARRNWPQLDGDDLEAKVRELEIDKLRAAGRRGRATQQHLTNLGAAFAAAHPELRASIAALLDHIDSLDPTPPEPITTAAATTGDVAA